MRVPGPAGAFIGPPGVAAGLLGAWEQTRQGGFEGLGQMMLEEGRQQHQAGARDAHVDLESPTSVCLVSHRDTVDDEEIIRGSIRPNGDGGNIPRCVKIAREDRRHAQADKT